MKVLHLYAGNLYGGVERILVTLAREADRDQMAPQFALCFEGRLSEELRAMSAPVHILGAVRLSRPWTGWAARKRLLALVKSQEVDVVVAHATWVWAIFGKALRSEGIKTALWVHARLQGTEQLDRLAARTKPDLIIAVSKDTAATITPMFPGVRTEVLYTPLPPLRTASGEERERVRREMGIVADQVVIAQVSRMEAWKGHRVHLEALARLKDLPHWICWQIGGAQRPTEAEYLESMKQLAAELGIADRVKFMGERRDVPVLLCAADMFCQPNLEAEGLGIVFLEALSNKLPAITTAIGGAQEVVDHTCGCLAPVNDVATLSAMLRELLCDPALRRRLGEAGPARVDAMCNPRNQLRKLKALLAEISPVNTAVETS